MHCIAWEAALHQAGLAGITWPREYGGHGLTLREHPVAFLRDTLQSRHVMTCADASAMRDRRLTRVAGLVGSTAALPPPGPS